MNTEASRFAMQPDEIFWRYDLAIKPGKLEAFLEVARALMAMMDQEPGTLGYRYHLNPDQTQCHIFEHYRDSDALVAHAEAFGKHHAAAFMEACEPQALAVYGNPNEGVRNTLAQYGAVFYTKIEPI